MDWASGVNVREVGQNGFFVRHRYVQSCQCTVLVLDGSDPFLKSSNAIQFEQGITRGLPSFSFEFFGEQRRGVGVGQGLAEQAQSNGVKRHAMGWKIGS